MCKNCLELSTRIKSLEKAISEKQKQINRSNAYWKGQIKKIEKKKIAA